jgi:predicted GIY-YIG superfamily endonuclease
MFNSPQQAFDFEKKIKKWGKKKKQALITEQYEQLPALSLHVSVGVISYSRY